MKTAMIYPNDLKEKAIHNYSEDLIKETNVDELTYTAGKPFSFPFRDSSIYDQVHIQHEYNLLGGYGIPFQFVFLWLMIVGIDVIVTMHNVIPRGDKRFGLSRRMFYVISNFIIKICCDVVIVHSQGFKDILIKDYNFKEERVRVIRHGVKEVSKFDREEVRKKLGLKGNVYLIIGNFHRNHQPYLILEQSKEIDGTILIVWNSSAVNDRNKKRLIEYFEESISGAYMSNIKVIDLNKEHKDMWWEFFYASDLVLLPYIDGIGSGIFNDAMATGTPVVCSNTKYFREVADGMKICPSDYEYGAAIKEAMDEINNLKSRSESYAEKFSIGNIGVQHLEVYNGL